MLYQWLYTWTLFNVLYVPVRPCRSDGGYDPGLSRAGSTYCCNPVCTFAESCKSLLCEVECRAAVLHCGNFMIRCTLVKSQNCHQGTGRRDWGQQRRQKWLSDNCIERHVGCRRWLTINDEKYLSRAYKNNLLTHFPPLRICLKILYSKFRPLSNIVYMTNLRTIDMWQYLGQRM